MGENKTVVETIDIPVEKIKPSPFQPRMEFNLEDIKGSILRDGILVPITVRRIENFYELIDGERRTRLARELGMKSIPATIIDVDDETADRMVWKVNTLRKEYTPKEKAYHWKKHQNDGMSVRGIARDHDERRRTVISSLNTIKLTELLGTSKYENLVWESKKLSLRHVELLGDLFNDGGATAPRLKQWLEQIIKQDLTILELEKARKPEIIRVEQKRIEAAKEAVGKYIPEIEIKEDPEEFRKAAEVLKRAAKRKEQANKTPEELEAERLKREHKKQEQLEKLKSKREAEKKAREEREQHIRETAASKARLEERKKLEKEKKRIEEEAQSEIKKIKKIAKEEVKEELKQDRDFLIEVAKEYIRPPIPETKRASLPTFEKREDAKRVIVIGLPMPLYLNITRFMEAHELMREPAAIRLIEKGLEVEGYV